MKCIDCGASNAGRFGRFEEGRYVEVARCESCRRRRHIAWRIKEGLRVDIEPLLAWVSKNSEELDEEEVCI